MSPQGLLALVSLVLIGAGVAVAVAPGGRSQAVERSAGSPSVPPSSSSVARRASLGSRQWIGLGMVAGGAALLLVGAVVLAVAWLMFTAVS